ncbi:MULTISPECIES: autotransporter domain-containing protein [unclassified Herbaspirillum]|uniref:autotransporter outer membrane beta-barrel domain-containing protein n=1 Tax=unclassified Herbaspirillum TaxID=2624150 RepID=UPI001E47859E|nr:MULTISPECIES: autotransporter domain-containing protein [unclassified Herbaspirillum]
MKQGNQFNKGKLSVLALALAGALAAIGAAHAQTVSTASGRVTWTNGDLLIDSNGSIGSTITGIVTGGTSLGTLTNQGTINATSLGIYNSSGNTVTQIVNETLIYGAATGIMNNGVIGSISNSGTIAASIAGNWGIFNNGSIGTLTNNVGGIINGGSANSGIRNFGTIGAISNSGTVTGDWGVFSQGSIGSLTNNAGALFQGITAGIQNQFGTITSLLNSGTFAGGTVVSSTTTVAGIVNTSGLIGTLVNSGIISGYDGIANGGTLNNNSSIGTIGTLNNTISGVISGVRSGINNSNMGTIGLLGNAGTIHGGDSGILNGGSIGSVANSGTISGNYGINNSGHIGSIDNTSTGNIISNFTGIANGTGSNTLSSIGTITNSGTISGAWGVNNYGSIVSVTNDSTGTIQGGIVGLSNRANGTIGSLSNGGTITSGVGITNFGRIGTMTNAVGALINGSQIGLQNDGTLGSLSNSGLITGTSTAGISTSGLITSLTNVGTISGNKGIDNSGQIGTLSNSGTISGGNNGIVSTGTIGTLNNTGLITGSLSAINLGSGTLSSFTNAGTIAGSIVNSTGNALTILGGSGSIFGTLTGSGGGIGAADIGNITSGTNLIFGAGNQLLNDNINVGANTVTNSGVLQLNNPVTITGNYAQNAGATLLIGVSSGATFSTGLSDTGYGRLVVNGNAVIASGSAITLKSLGYNFAQGQRYVVMAASGNGTNYNASGLVYSATGYAVTASVQTDSGNAAYSDLVLTLGSTGGSGDSSSTKPRNNATTSNATSALGGLFKYSGTDAALLAVFNPAAALDSTAAANKAGAQLSPAAINTAASKAVDAASQAIGNVVASRLDGFHIAQAGSSGVATGERSAEIATWGQVFGGSASQDLRDNVSGYHANYRGLLIGTDGLVTDRIRAGALVSAAKTSVSSDGDNTGSSADINSYGLTAYATYTGTPWYVNVMAGAMRQQYSTVRTISYTGFSGVADGSFHGSQYLTSVQAGYPLNLDAWLPGATLTPIAGLSYSTLRQNGYTETGGNGAALSVNASSSNSLKSELGAKLENTYTVSYGKLLPSVQLGWRHEYRDRATQTGASFVADSTGSTAFVTRSATPVSNIGVLNLGVTLLRSNNLSLTGKYTLETGGGYTAQTGSVQVRWQY